MLGTIAGAVVALLLMGLLANFPAALFLSIGFAALMGFFVSMIDQTPRGYFYLMAGINAAVIGLPDALDPLSGFTTAMVRTEEILLGIACATVIDTVFFPHPAGAILNARVAAWLQRAQTYTLNALDGADTPAEELSALATDAAQLDALAFHVSYDIVPNRPRPRVVRLLHTRMLLLIRLMFAAGDWASAFCSGPGATPRTREALGAARDWVRALPAASAEQAEAALRAIEALHDAPDAPDAAMTLRQRGLALVLRELVLSHQDCAALQRTVAEGAALPDHLRVAARSEPLSVPYRDPVRALLVLLPVALAFLLVFLYWTATGWDEGATAALMTLVAGLFASSSPEPAVQLVRVLAVTAVAVAVAIVYQFAVLPGVQGFPLLMLTIGLFLVPAGAFIPITSTGMMLTVLFTLMLSLQPEYDARFEAVADGALGTLAGLAATAVLAQMTRAPGSAWTARHLLRVGWSDLAAISAGRWHPRRAAYALRALNRFTVLAPQLNGREQDLTTAALLDELRIGLNLLRLGEDEPALPAAARAVISAMRRDVAGYFDARRHGRSVRPDGLRAPTAAAMAAAAAAGASSAWLMLAGVQRSLFGAAETGDAG
jgi:uncharacterized membrane protein YccC